MTGPNGTKDPDIATKLAAMTEALAAEYDAFQDNPWPLVYRRMDALYPGSKFILTVRDPDRWLESSVRDFGERDSPMRQLIYGVGHPKGNEALYRERMLRHNRGGRGLFPRPAGGSADAGMVEEAGLGAALRVPWQAGAVGAFPARQYRAADRAAPQVGRAGPDRRAFRAAAVN